MPQRGVGRDRETLRKQWNAKLSVQDLSECFFDHGTRDDGPAGGCQDVECPENKRFKFATQLSKRAKAHYPKRNSVQANSLYLLLTSSLSKKKTQGAFSLHVSLGLLFILGVRSRS
jgi:hypothetical protein